MGDFYLVRKGEFMFTVWRIPNWKCQVMDDKFKVAHIWLMNSWYKILLKNLTVLFELQSYINWGLLNLFTNGKYGNNSKSVICNDMLWTKVHKHL